MYELETKYLDDTLSVEELEGLRHQINTEPLSAKEARLSEAWMSGKFRMRDNKTALDSLKRDIDVENGRRTDFRRIYPKVLVAAACLAFIVLTTSVIFLSKDKMVNVDNTILIATEAGEKANVTLPDGTTIKLGENSSVKYTQGQFNQKIRAIQFVGEGYFNVAKCPEKPFAISSAFVDVRVLGTKFLFLSKPEMKQVELVLDEGSVNITSNRTESSATLEAGQKAAFNFNTGEIIVSGSKVSGKDSFSNTSIRFINTSLDDVLKELSEIYGVSFVVNSLPEKGYFTGHLSTTDLGESLDVISRIYNLHIIERTDSVIISKN